MKKLAIITTHPIQYYAPVFQLLHKRGKLDVKVFYTWGEASAHKFDPGFNKKIKWDIPLLEGYPYEWVKNTSKEPGTHHFKGIVNPDLIGQIKNWEPDALLIYGWGFQSHLKVLRYFKNKVSIFFRGDSTLLDEKKGAKAILKTAFLKWVYRHVDHAFYPGTNTKAYFKKYGLKDEQLSFAPHAIDNGRFAADRSDEVLLLRRKLGIKDDEILILFAGKFEEKKSPVLLLEAFMNLNATGTHLLFAGNGPLEEQLKLKAEKNGRVHFIDFQNQSQMPVVFQACDLFCLPSKGPGETWGLAINEAMAAGKAILASDKVGAVADLVEPGKNGEIFSADTASDLTRKLDQLICKGKSGLAEMGKSSKVLIERWTIEEQVNVIENAVKNG
ncbi:glycosyltransferase family 4 protein [Mucilaginibacter sp.]|uniref:glycosyltransferase family 4 protein n=1 Tax=Mucilaginibacter sp. TaxID=1882438 RepID=UPI0028472F14|nr:glycosyltransferase family 4 protein [Mucilaginibacter sp.]MDR3695477.1 glycosyltransferase family 4 protein [Mucilaginibacter sp.]